MTDGVTALLGSTAETLPGTAAPSAEYIAEMQAKVHGDPTPAPLQPQSPNKRPDHVPEKFWDPVKGEARWDDLAKSYAELEKARGAAPAAPKVDEQADPNAPKADDKAPGTKIERPDGEANPLTAAVETMAASYAESGEVTEDQIKAVEDLGLPRQVIDTYMAGLKALAQVGLQAVHTAAGGEQAYTDAVTWAATNLSDADLAYYNDNVDGPGRQQTVEWLMAKFRSARPSEGKLVGGQAASAGAGDVFTSQQQLKDAMSSRDYQTDPAFRQKVAEKLARSKAAGIMNVGADYSRRSL